MIRWTFAAACRSGLPTLALIAVGGCASPPPVHTASTVTNSPLDHASATLAATQRYFGVHNGTGLYVEDRPSKAGAGKYATEWPFSQVHVGVLDLASARPDDPALGAALSVHRKAQMHYWTDASRNGVAGFESEVTPPLGHGGDLYYDDNEWVGLAALQHWQVFHDAGSLDLAKRIFTLLRSAWDGDPDKPHPGGLVWTQKVDNHDRNTVSNMPGAEMGVRLYQATGDQSYLTDALRWYAWTNRTFQRPGGLYIDHIDGAGQLDRRVFSYNQGVPIGVNVLLYQATGKSQYLAEAKRIAEAAQDYYAQDDRLVRQAVPFNAIYFKNLLLLESVTGGTRYRSAMQDYSARMWRDYRDPETGLFRAPHDRHSGFHLIDQGAMIQIDAVLGWEPSRYALLY